VANVFNVPEEVLTGEQGIPPASGGIEPPQWEAPRDQWNIRVDGAIRNAFGLTSIRYKIPVTRIIELAPLLFVLAAEQSLARRSSQLAKLDEAITKASAAASVFHHLPCNVDPDLGTNDPIAAEEESIRLHDILAERLDDRLFRHHRPQKKDYYFEEDNPFVSYLKDMVTQVAEPGLASICSFSQDHTDIQVCKGVAEDLAGGNAELAKGIVDGWAPLYEIRELLGPESLVERVAWLQKKKEEHQAARARMLDGLIGDFELIGGGQ